MRLGVAQAFISDLIFTLKKVITEKKKNVKQTFPPLFTGKSTSFPFCCRDCVAVVP